MQNEFSKWDARFLALAQLVARFSKDPSSQVGAVIVRPDRTVASFGYNGFARDVDDTPERLSDRKLKYPLTIHAELNATLNAKEPLNGCTAYVTHMPCASCASVLIQAGIIEVVAFQPNDDMLSRWADSFNLTQAIFSEAGVSLILLDREDVLDYAWDNLGVEFDPWQEIAA